MPTKPVEYRLTPEAERDVEAIWLYTLEKWGLEQANRYTDDLTEAFALGDQSKNGDARRPHPQRVSSQPCRSTCDLFPLDRIRNRRSPRAA